MLKKIAEKKEDFAPRTIHSLELIFEPIYGVVF